MWRITCAGRSATSVNVAIWKDVLHPPLILVDGGRLLYLVTDGQASRHALDDSLHHCRSLELFIIVRVLPFDSSLFALIQGIDRLDIFITQFEVEDVKIGFLMIVRRCFHDR